MGVVPKNIVICCDGTSHINSVTVLSADVSPLPVSFEGKEENVSTMLDKLLKSGRENGGRAKGSKLGPAD